MTDMAWLVEHVDFSSKPDTVTAQPLYHHPNEAMLIDIVCVMIFDAVPLHMKSKQETID